jgi:transposase
VVDAVLLEGRSAGEVARAHGISRSWIYELIGRFRAGGYEALERLNTSTSDQGLLRERMLRVSR